MDDAGKFKGIVTFDCRGIEPIDFMPGTGWIVVYERTGTVFRDVDLSEKEWVEYDDKAKQSVGVYELESQFVKVKWIFGVWIEVIVGGLKFMGLTMKFI